MQWVKTRERVITCGAVPLMVVVVGIVEVVEEEKEEEERASGFDSATPSWK